MVEQFKIKPTATGWAIMARKGAGKATEAAWLSLGGCPSHIVAMRVYEALKARDGM